MKRQVLFCMETNIQAGTDYKYIKETVMQFCDIDRFKDSLKPIYMGSKGAFDSPKVKRQINQYRKGFDGKTIVIYFIDTDQMDRISSDKTLFDKVKDYCMKNDYEFVWFYRDIEDVYLGRQIDKTRKTIEASNFSKNRKIESFDPVYLKSNNYKHHYSNFLNVLRKYFDMKNGG